MPAELWSGSVVLSSLAGVALGLLAAPPPGSTATSPNGQPEVDATAPTPTALTDLERRRLSW